MSKRLKVPPANVGQTSSYTSTLSCCFDDRAMSLARINPTHLENYGHRNRSLEIQIEHDPVGVRNVL